jgi:hypothetical protein
MFEGRRMRRWRQCFCKSQLFTSVGYLVLSVVGLTGKLGGWMTSDGGGEAGLTGVEFLAVPSVWQLSDEIPMHISSAGITAQAI